MLEYLLYKSMCVYIHIDRYRLTAQHRNYMIYLNTGAGSSAEKKKRAQSCQEAGASLAS